jgi:hypothetical protein
LFPPTAARERTRKIAENELVIGRRLSARLDLQERTSESVTLSVEAVPRGMAQPAASREKASGITAK